MRAMVLRGHDLAIEEVPVPEPGPGQVLARVLACGICGTDLHTARFPEDMVRIAKASPRAAWYSTSLTEAGVIMGHEFVAEVVRSGPGAEDWAPGTRVTGVPVIPDPASPSGMHSIGFTPGLPGGYSEYVLMAAPFLLRVPDNVPDDVAATTEPSAVGLHAVRQARIAPGESALVLGGGPVGLMTLLWLKHEGISYVAVSEFTAERRALARRLGADDVFDPREVDLAAAISEALARRQDAPPGALRAPDVVFECVGVPGTIQQAMELVRHHGRIVVVGVCMQPDRFEPLLGINKQLSLQFVLGYTAQEYAEALAAHADGSVDTRPLITRKVGLDELPATFRALADPKDCKVLVIPSGV